MVQFLLARAGLMFAGHGLKIGLAVGLLAMVVTWDRGRIRQAEQRGVQNERAAVQATGAKISKKAEAASKAAKSRPDHSITKYYRD